MDSLVSEEVLALAQLMDAKLELVLDQEMSVKMEYKKKLVIETGDQKKLVDVQIEVGQKSLGNVNEQGWKVSLINLKVDIQRVRSKREMLEEERMSSGDMAQ